MKTASEELREALELSRNTAAAGAPSDAAMEAIQRATAKLNSRHDALKHSLSAAWKSVVEGILPRKRIVALERQLTQPHHLSRIVYGPGLSAAILKAHADTCFESGQLDGIELHHLMFQARNGISIKFAEYVAMIVASQEYDYNSRNRTKLYRTAGESASTRYAPYFAYKDREYYGIKLLELKAFFQRVSYDRVGLLRYFGPTEVMPKALPRAIAPTTASLGLISAERSTRSFETSEPTGSSRLGSAGSKTREDFMARTLRMGRNAYL
jgi:hypothetical protein